MSLIKLKRKSQPVLQSKKNELRSRASKKKNHFLDFAKLHFSFWCIKFVQSVRFSDPGLRLIFSLTTSLQQPWYLRW